MLCLLSVSSIMSALSPTRGKHSADWGSWAFLCCIHVRFSDLRAFLQGKNQQSQVAACKYHTIPLLKVLWWLPITGGIESKFLLCSSKCAHHFLPLLYHSPDSLAKPSFPHSLDKS